MIAGGEPRGSINWIGYVRLDTHGTVARSKELSKE